MSETQSVESKKKPTVLFIMHMPPPIHGASVVGQFIKDSELINDAFDCHYINLTTAKNMEDIGKGGIGKIALFLEKVVKVHNAIQSLRPSIIYMTPCTSGGPFVKDNLMLSFAKIFAAVYSRKSRFVIHLHNKGVQTMQDDWKYSVMYRSFFSNMHVILLGESLYADIAKYVKRSNVLICPNGIPDVETHLDEKVHNEVPRVLWLSHIMLTKGLMEFLDALSILNKRGVKFMADFVGGITGEITQAEFEDEIEMRGLSDIVEYHGNKFGRRKDDFLRQADIFVLPSYTEAFPLTILEAMQFALPVVASNVGGISSQIEDGVNGFLLGGKEPIMQNTFRPDPQELADRLERLLCDRELCVRMGQEGRRRYEAHFTLPTFEHNFKQALETVLETPSIDDEHEKTK